MRVLEITFNEPNKSSGGGMGIYQSIISLSEYADVDYIGPKYEESLFLDTHYPVRCIQRLESKKRSNILKFFRLITRGITTSFYDSWNNVATTVEWNKYDLVHIEFSRYGFLVKEVHKHCLKCVIRMHNIETDYSLNLFKKSRTFSDFCKFLSFSRNEKVVIKDADCLVFLTKNDLIRADEVGRLNPDRAFMIPVCISSKNNIESHHRQSRNFLITGTLSYGPNAEGIIWFLQNVWHTIINQCDMIDDVKLIIAGSRPNKQIMAAVRESKNVNLIDSPNDMEPFFRMCDCYVSVVFDGAGMKVKVGEAFSYGLPVIGTSHSFIGYEKMDAGMYIADSSTEFISRMKEFIFGETKPVEKEAICKCFDDNYSMDSSCRRYREIIEKMTH